MAKNRKEEKKAYHKRTYISVDKGRRNYARYAEEDIPDRNSHLDPDQENKYISVDGAWIDTVGFGPYRNHMNVDARNFEQGLASFLRLYDFELNNWTLSPSGEIEIRGTTKHE